MSHRPAVVQAPRSSFAGFRFPPEVIMLAVGWYLRYGLSYRDVEELLAERGIAVDHVTIYRWVQPPGDRRTPSDPPARHEPASHPGAASVVQDPYRRPADDLPLVMQTTLRGVIGW